MVSKTPPSAGSVSEAPASRAYTTSMSSGQGAATAPARISPKSNEEVEMPQVDAPAFASLGATSE